MRHLGLFAKAALGLLVASAAALLPGSAAAFSPYLVVPEPAAAEATPAFRHANLSDAEAYAELDRRHVLYQRLENVSGVRAPVRLTGRLHGVHFHSGLPEQERVTSYQEILDARLALALDDFAQLLEEHQIDEVVHLSLYRPASPVPPRALDPLPMAQKPAGARPRAAEKPLPALSGKAALDARKPRLETASKQKNGALAGEEKDEPGFVRAPAPAKGALAKGRAVTKKRVAHRDPQGLAAHGTWAPAGTRHPAGLAIDVGLLKKKDGRWISVARQFHGHLGDKTCGEGAKVPGDADAKELRALVCESFARGIFTYALTPNFDAAHADHFHMEVKGGVRWFLYH